MTILPLTYMGSTAYFSRLVTEECVIDAGENWIKQTARNRCEILTAGGIAPLTVPVHACGEKIAARDVRIDNSKRWQHTHWASLVSAYRNSPFFDHYEERFAPFYHRKYDFIYDFNRELLSLILDIFGFDISDLEISETYIEATASDLDLRAKKALRREYDGVILPSYVQVFPCARQFEGGLSVADLLFCESASPALKLLRSRRDL